MTSTKNLTYIVLITIALISIGCEDSSVFTSDVTGTVYGSYNGQPMPNTKVVIAGRTTYTSSFGKFSFDNVPFPFDAVVYDSSYEMAATLYRNLSTGNVNLYSALGYGTTNSVSGIHLVVWSGLNLNNPCMIFFSDGTNINRSFYIYSHDNNLNIPLPSSEPVTGKVYLLAFRKNSSGVIQSYDNYGVSSSITLSPGHTSVVNFDSASVSANPGEAVLNGSFGTDYCDADIYFAFGSNTANFNFTTYSYIVTSVHGTSFSIKVPTGISEELKILAGIYHNTPDGTSRQFSQLFLNGENLLLQKEMCSLTTPSDNASDVTNQTLFSFHPGVSGGVFRYDLENASRDVYYEIYSTETSFTLEALDQLGLGKNNNNYFNWSVSQLGPSASMNDFVSTYSSQVESYVTTTTPRRFMTLP